MPIMIFFVFHIKFSSRFFFFHVPSFSFFLSLTFLIPTDKQASIVRY